MRNYPPSYHINQELRSLAQEIKHIRSDSQANRPQSKQPESIFHNPVLLAILGVIGTIATGVWQLHANRELEREKLRSTLIQEASKSGDPKTTLRNLNFLVTLGILKDENGKISTLKLEEAPSFTSEKPKPLSRTEINEMFGDPKIQVADGSSLGALGKPDEAWVAENLIVVDLPQLKNVRGFPPSGKIRFHKKAAPHLKAAIEEIAERGLLSRIESFGGAWVPRMSQSGAYSAHAFGIAIDLNVESNSIGRKPPAIGTKGSVLELVPIFERHGFFWGGYFSQLDGNHFQYGVKTPTVQIAGPSSSNTRTEH